MLGVAAADHTAREHAAIYPSDAGSIELAQSD